MVEWTEERRLAHAEKVKQGREKAKARRLKEKQAEQDKADDLEEKSFGESILPTTSTDIKTEVVFKESAEKEYKELEEKEPDPLQGINYSISEVAVTGEEKTCPHHKFTLSITRSVNGSINTRRFAMDVMPTTEQILQSNKNF